MARTGRQRRTDDRVREAERACGELGEALEAAGVRLPSLGLDPVSCAGSAPLGLIELGRCNVETARALAAALRSRTAGGTP
ncbi:hypothetical protein LUX12_04810 [Streptomyces somaliensis]|uniref:Uncharacterized protein n=1 Tax=Streptomyces somaliensis (strain ATCC 33201 / DSM 40738 / JCM 12659 / KCTC 9044 / NCTC 11332 / NRRL B-12077 / IP 733) TaxID=1134445 RepID=A0AA44DCS1_STRE0|nr:hypothetical protein [Streptomyces somaliensis]MCP9944263.1 hypothetical protein [Streptomyces somaliensis]MCP9962500.1 hypothetical protein [Streptomyces somaliensis]MCP9975327.1 hypothetical protein [Streptomyces somaliensis]MCQ0023252.1 hypothetical protein [Streptomyces somaliensis DSM 40738]NKY13811.1 hypothetical protein [Streptomyces somaliensis DSM 40738]